MCLRMTTFSMYLHETKDSNVWMMPGVSVPELTDEVDYKFVNKKSKA